MERPPEASQGRPGRTPEGSRTICETAGVDAEEPVGWLTQMPETGALPVSSAGAEDWPWRAPGSPWAAIGGAMAMPRMKATRVALVAARSVLKRRDSK